MNDMQKMVKKTDDFIKANLVECCRELKEWNDTSILPDGKIREAAAMYRPYMAHNDLQCVRSQVETFAVAFVANLPR